MSDWKVEKKGRTLGSALLHDFSFGFVDEEYRYELTHKDTQEVKHAVARNSDELGEKIARGMFDD